MKTTILTFLLLTVLLIPVGCKKGIQLSPPETSVSSESAYTTDATAIAVLTSLYAKLSSANNSNSTSIANFSIWSGGLSADEYSIFSATYAGDPYYVNNLSALGSGTEIWTNIFSDYMYTCNAAIEGISASNSLTPSVKTQLIGEAKFMRAFFYFYLVNLYGDVPLVLSTNYKINRNLSRSPKADVYHQIITDLLEAKKMLSSSYLSISLTGASTERVRPIKSAASALLSRVYLFINEWNKAESEATEVIDLTSLYSLQPLNQVFNKNSLEAIFQIQPTTLYFNTGDATFLVIPSTGFSGTNYLYMNSLLFNSFEAGDLRSTEGNWINKITIDGTDYHYPFKYKVNELNTFITTPSDLSEYLMVLRLGEQYLIRSESRAHLDNLAGAISDIDKIRARAGLPLLASTVPGISKNKLLDTILHERQVELFSEWGHRWLDLKRTNKVNSVMSNATALKGGTWEAHDAFYPLPQQDILHNSKLIQNEGY